MARNRIILRTDAGEELGRFPNTHDARSHANTLAKELSLVIATDDGVVMMRRFSQTQVREIETAYLAANNAYVAQADGRQVSVARDFGKTDAHNHESACFELVKLLGLLEVETGSRGYWKATRKRNGDYRHEFVEQAEG